MRPAHFDTLSRTLGRHRSRRTMLTALLAGPLARLGARETAARRHKRNPCKHQPDDFPCKTDGRCLSGFCNPRPQCDETGTACIPNDNACCSGGCALDNGGYRCLSSGTNNTPCYADGDCNPPLSACRGYRCISPECKPASDYCADGAATCNDGFACLRPLGGGDSRCGYAGGSLGCGCTSQEQCVKSYGYGAFCATFQPGANCSCNGKHTLCALPH